MVEHFKMKLEKFCICIYEIATNNKSIDQLIRRYNFTNNEILRQNGPSKNL